MTQAEKNALAVALAELEAKLDRLLATIQAATP